VPIISKLGTPTFGGEHARVVPCRAGEGGAQAWAVFFKRFGLRSCRRSAAGSVVVRHASLDVLSGGTVIAVRITGYFNSR